MTESAIGLILRTRPLTETSLIVNWLTAEHGRIATVAKGARRPKSPFAGKLDLFYQAEFTFRRSRRSELHALREVSLKATHAALRTELAYLQQAAYGAALIAQATETDTPLPGAFALLRGLLEFLPQQPPLPQTVFALELKLLHELGLAPDLAESNLTPGARQIASRLIPSAWPDIARLKLSPAQLTEFQRYLHGFLIFHLGKIPRSRPALA